MCRPVGPGIGPCVDLAVTAAVAMGNAMGRTGALQRKVGFNPPCLRITQIDMTPAPILASLSALHLSDRLAAASDPQVRRLGRAAACELRAPPTRIRG